MSAKAAAPARAHGSIVDAVDSELLPVVDRFVRAGDEDGVAAGERVKVSTAKSVASRAHTHTEREQSLINTQRCQRVAHVDTTDLC
jgi:hypothetical protein